MKKHYSHGLILIVLFIITVYCYSSGENIQTAPSFKTNATPTPAKYQYFAFVPNQGSNNISVYSINAGTGDAATGALTEVSGSPFAAGQGPSSVTVNPTGKFAYVANYNSNDVWAYSIGTGIGDTATGALTAIGSSPLTTGSGPKSITIDPTGKFVYVANYNTDNVSAYFIDTVTGALTEMSGSPFAAGQGPCSVIVDPSGKFVYVANVSSNNISTYSISTGTGDTATGVLTEISGSPFATGQGPS